MGVAVPSTSSCYDMKSRDSRSESAGTRDYSSLSGILISVFLAAVAMASPAGTEASPSVALVPFSNANPYADSFKLAERNFLIGRHTIMIRQSWEERSESDLE